MAHSLPTSAPKWLYFFEQVDSTNNYAMELIEDGLAHHGDAVWALHQWAGKGQRGKSWTAQSAESLMFSLIIRPQFTLENSAVFNKLIAISVAEYLRERLPKAAIYIKWPNDIYVNDKKSCGILIENSLRGSNWQYAIVGIGINVLQQQFDDSLPNATSLWMAEAQTYSLYDLLSELRTRVLDYLADDFLSFTDVHQLYNQLLYKKSQAVRFWDAKNQTYFSAIVEGVNESGELVVTKDGALTSFTHGTYEWIIEN